MHSRTIFNLLLIVFIFNCVAFGQSDPGDKRITIHIDRAPFGKVIEYMTEKYDVPIGVEVSTLSDAEDLNFELDRRFQISTSTEQRSVGELTFSAKKSSFSLNYDDATLGRVLDDLVGQLPNYQWEVNEGVVNIRPKQGRDPLFQKLLTLKIETFDISQPVFIYEIENQLLRLPEIKGFATTNSTCLVNLDALNPIFSRRRLSSELHFQDISLLELLNKIVLKKRGGWVLRRNWVSKSYAGCVNLQV